jgi:iron complex transport system permease protein
MRSHAPRVLLALAVGLVGIAIAAIGRGAVALSAADVIAALASPLGIDVADVSERQVAIVWAVRLPRVVLAALVGAALACAGAALQGVVRNALADPALIGVSGGAALGAVSAFVLGGSLLAHSPFVFWFVPGAAFLGAVAATRLALQLARVDGVISGVTILLAGVGLAALTGAAVGVLLYLADDAALRSITFWNLGSVGGATWPVVAAAALPIAIGIVLMPRLADDLDRLALGELEARHVGVDVDRLIRRVTVLAALAVGAAVATCGAIGFVGLVVPYLARAAVGPGHRALLPACALGGALLLVLADLIARTIVAPAEMPIGVVTALAGAPVLLALVRRGRGATVTP